MLCEQKIDNRTCYCVYACGLSPDSQNSSQTTSTHIPQTTAPVNSNQMNGFLISCEFVIQKFVMLILQTYIVTQQISCLFLLL